MGTLGVKPHIWCPFFRGTLGISRAYLGGESHPRSKACGFSATYNVNKIK